MTGIKKIGVFTSGGDAPGMNACIRAVVRTALFEGVEVAGIRQGYQGMLESNFWDMSARDVGNIIHIGGTILKTAPCLEFKTREGTKKAYENLKQYGIDALVAIGGDGTANGASRLSQNHGIPVMYIPKIKEKFDFYDSKVTILGHLQRGGSPSSFDRVLASRLGFAAVRALLNGKNRQMVGLRGNAIVLTPLEEALHFSHFKLEDDLLEMINVLSI